MELQQSFYDFFKDLARNNNKEWMDEHRKEYSDCVKKPFHEIAKVVWQYISEDQGDFLTGYKDGMFRINRDVRFSKEKHPYNMHVSMVLAPKGKKDDNNPGFFFRVDVEGVTTGGGLYQPSKEMVDSIRRKIIQKPEELDKILKDITPEFGALKGDKNKVLPKEIKSIQEVIPDYAYNKQWYVMKRLEGDELMKAKDVSQFMIDEYQKLKGFIQYFKITQ